MAKKVKNVVKKKNIKLSFEAISVEGGLISPEWLYKISQMEAQFQSEQDYGIHKGLNIRDEIGRYWRIANAHWTDFNQGISSSQSESISKTFVLKLLKDCFVFSDVIDNKEHLLINERNYPITLIANRTTPVVVTPSKQDQDIDTQLIELGDDGRKRNTYGLCQEYLNSSEEAKWGFATDGRTFRILRDNSSLTRPTWIEIDLEKIFTEGLFSEFTTIWLLLHSSRFTKSASSIQNDPIIEKWRESSIAEGVRARDHLRSGVENAIILLGNGFLQNAKNRKVRENLQTGEISPSQFHQELLRLIYRLIFILTAEERSLLHPNSADEKVKTIYRDGYSLKRLREKSIKHSQFDHHEDIWESLKIVFMGLTNGQSRLGLPALGGLFDRLQCANIDSLYIENRFLLQAIFHLSWIKTQSGINRINWRDMGSEELGSVYESLLELVPQISENASKFNYFSEPESKGNVRKSTGSYYTPDNLVQAVLDDSLEPLISTTINNNPENSADSLLQLQILDPACGSGHFLLAAARRLASHIARLKNDGTPSAQSYRDALRLVVSHCIYGVDRNPMAIELAKISLWLEAMTPEAPLSFLDHHLVHGDALIGTMGFEIFEKGIPNAAYKALTGDDPKVCKSLALENSKKIKELEKARKDVYSEQLFNISEYNLAPMQKQIEKMPDNTLAAVELKHIATQNYESISANSYLNLAADMYVCAFFSIKNETTQSLIPTTGDILKALRGILPSINAINFIKKTSHNVNALHWQIKFPKVFSEGGFDLVLGNPPWERVKLQEQEFFASRAPDIANNKNASARKKLIADLDTSNPILAQEWRDALRNAENESRYYRESERFPFGGVGDVNTYAVFADLFKQAISPKGSASLLLPNGLVTGFTYRDFLKHLLETQSLKSFYGFENEDKIFPDVHNETKFGILTLHGISKPVEKLSFTAHIRQPDSIHNKDHRYSLTIQDIKNINPNTMNLPSFRWAQDAEITATIHKSFSIFLRRNDDGTIENNWGLKFSSMFHMSNDSHLFLNHIDVASKITSREMALAILEDKSRIYPLYEGKMFWHFDHRYGTYLGQTKKQENKGVLPHVSDEDHVNPDYRIQPRYWIHEDYINNALNGIDSSHFYGWRDVGISERTFIGTVLPKAAFGNTIFLLNTNQATKLALPLYAILSSLVADYDARQRSMRMNFYVVEQLAIPSPSELMTQVSWINSTSADWLLPRAFELYYTSAEIGGVAKDLEANHPPFKWNKERRHLIQCEIDAFILHLYNLNRSQSEWLLNSFHVLKKYEEKEFGEFKTKTIVLEIFDKMAEAKRSNQIYVSQLSPSPADTSLTHQC